uniref:protein-tyrosine-phosphatase n=1 Tax=Vitrella brassicaformis TaxID=1169539 RepID=A0A7S1JVN7_9ALVE
MQLKSVMDRNFGAKTVTIVDCRYGAEFNGGHIRGALHGKSIDVVKEALWKPNGQPKYTNEHVIVFHCEYSKARGPSRTVPSCMGFSYSKVFIFDGGYNNFYRQHAKVRRRGRQVQIGG